MAESQTILSPNNQAYSLETREGNRPSGRGEVGSDVKAMKASAMATISFLLTAIFFDVVLSSFSVGT